MKVKINNAITAGVQSGHTVKLYSVPHSYSPDGYYLTIFTKDKDMEPYPACKGNDSKLLLHAEVYQEIDGTGSVNIIHAEPGNTIEVVNG